MRKLNPRHESAEDEEEGRAMTGENGEPSGTEKKTATTRRGSHRRKLKLSWQSGWQKLLPEMGVLRLAPDGEAFLFLEDFVTKGS